MREFPKYSARRARMSIIAPTPLGNPFAESSGAAGGVKTAVAVDLVASATTQFQGAVCTTSAGLYNQHMAASSCGFHKFGE